MHRPSFERLIRSARSGSRDDLGELLEQFRQHLRLIASSSVESGAMHGGSTPDLVQETFLKAQARLKGFTGRTEEEFKGWLQQILVNILKDWRRYNVAENRDVRREASLDTLTDWDTGEIPSADARPAGS
jgi:DNA-directed RNA polymerase specialized sigma24 family protein